MPEKKVSEMTQTELRGTIQAAVLTSNIGAGVFMLLLLFLVRTMMR